jgi:hypothetical protein
MSTTRYFIDRDLDGTVSHLVRIHRDEHGLWGEFFQEGEWIEGNAALEFLYEPGYGEEVDESTAAKIAFELGGNL